MPGTVKSGLLSDADRRCKCDSQEKLVRKGCWMLDLPLDKGHFITEFAPFTCDSYPASDLWVAHFDVTGSLFKCFMLDKPSTQGFSGGPVISFAKADAPVCYGIIHGTRQDNTGGKLAIVVHSAYLFELIEYAKNT